MKQFYFNYSIVMVLAFVLFTNTKTNAQNDGSAIYVNDMDYVLGDVKQVFIQNLVTTTTQADNLIEGFKKLHVNGIRIPIFADGVNPNTTMYDYFFNAAKAAGFKIFANPAQSSGGHRIACGVLDNTGGLCDVHDDNDKSLVLINRIKAFAAQYQCDWINPFNEDGSPGGPWTSEQINTIYASVNGNINGAQLIGPCVWGLPGSISVMEGTTVRNNISVATAHNLGFHHDQWDDFIALADEYNLPVWDSEVNHFDKFGTGTRLEAAIAAGVDGLVLYNSWNTISLTDGSINTEGEDMMDVYLKFRTDKTYFIDCVGTNRRLAASGSSETPVSYTGTGSTGDWVKWVFVDKGNGYYHIRRAAGGALPGLRTDNTSSADMQSSDSDGSWTYFDFSAGASTGSYFITLPIYTGSYRRLQINNAGDVRMVGTGSTGSWVSFTFTQADDYNARVSERESVVENISKEDMGLIVFPNPVKDRLHFSANKDVFKVEIFDLLGSRIVSRKVSNDNSIDMSAMIQGTYFVKCMNAEGLEITTVKVLKK